MFRLQLWAVDLRDLIEVREFVEMQDTEPVTYQGREFAPARTGEHTWAWCRRTSNPPHELTRRYKSYDAAFRARNEAFRTMRGFMGAMRKRGPT